MLRQIDLNFITDFVRIAEFGNITKAALALGVPKAKLSRNLALLENQLKVQLAYRTTRSFQLTTVGEEFYQLAKLHLNGIEQGLLDVIQHKEEFKGTLKVTAPEDFGNYIVTPLVAEFSKLYPFVRFELIYTNEVMDLIKYGIDIAFRIGNLKDSSLFHKKVGRIEFCLVASPQYLKTIPEIKKVTDLSNLSTVGFSGSQIKHWDLFQRTDFSNRAEVGRRTRLKTTSKIESNNFVAIRNLVLNNAGIGLIPRFLCERYFESGDLVHILKDWTRSPIPVQIVLPAQKNRTALNKSFFEFMSSRLSGELKF